MKHGGASPTGSHLRMTELRGSFYRDFIGRVQLQYDESEHLQQLYAIMNPLLVMPWLHGTLEWR